MEELSDMHKVFAWITFIIFIYGVVSIVMDVYSKYMDCKYQKMWVLQRPATPPYEPFIMKTTLQKYCNHKRISDVNS